jgi:hypothetical protein
MSSIFSSMSAYPVGRATRYPTIGGIPIRVHMGGNRADGKPMDEPVALADDRPEVHMNALAIAQLGDLIVWKEYLKENHGQSRQDGNTQRAA